MVASQIQHAAIGIPVVQAPSTAASIEMLQDPELLDEFMSPIVLDADAVVDKIGEEFAKYETPIGMINKLLTIRDRHLNFIIDDSGSMSWDSDVLLKDATPYVLRKRDPGATRVMTRWEEAEDRLHIMIDLLAYIPTKPIKISFLNSSHVIHLTRNDLTPDEFKNEAHLQITAAFTTPALAKPTNGTPSYRALEHAFATTSEPSMHYFFTDGVPSDRSPEDVADLIITRKNADKNALTLISCTNTDSDTEWMKLVDGKAPFCAEVDDFGDEKEEVLKKQGPGLPYTRGLWILCQLAGPINPHDLDAMDETLPFTKSTLDNVLGRILTAKEYQYYFERNPSASFYMDVYERFLTEIKPARAIVSKDEQKSRETRARFTKDGYAPAVHSTIEQIGQQLQGITNRHMPIAPGATSTPRTGLGTLAATFGMMSTGPSSNPAQPPQQNQDNGTVFKMGGQR